MPETNDSGEVLRQVVELATGEIQEIARHVATIDTCLRGDIEGSSPGLIHRLTTIETACRQNHGVNGNRQVPVPSEVPVRPQVIWTVDKIITAICAGLALLAGSFGALTSTCNSREIRRDSRRWHNRPAAVEPAPADSAGP